MFTVSSVQKQQNICSSQTYTRLKKAYDGYKTSKRSLFCLKCSLTRNELQICKTHKYVQIKQNTLEMMGRRRSQSISKQTRNTVGQNDQIQPESEAHSNKPHQRRRKPSNTRSSCGSKNEKRNRSRQMKRKETT